MMKSARTIMLIGLALGFAAGLRAQNLPGMQAALAKQYSGRPLLMQNFRSGSTLHFSSNGAFIKGGHPGPWTLDAYFQAKTVKLEPKALRLRGRRVLFAYAKTAHRLEPVLGRKLTLKIRTNPNSQNLASLKQALGRVFAPPSEKLADLVPRYWKYSVLHPINCAVNSSCKARADEVIALMLGHPNDAKKVCGDITEPKLLRHAEPPYTLEAHEAGLQGYSVWATVIGTNGRVKDAMVLQPLGMGLDEQAIRTLRTWTFKPATCRGKPVTVPIVIEIRFRLVG